MSDAETTSKRFSIVPRRRYTLVAEDMGGGQRTARWFHDKETGRWRPAESWKRPNFRYTLDTEQVAYVLSLIGEVQS